jgi:hypothetical protein
MSPARDRLPGEIRSGAGRFCSSIPSCPVKSAAIWAISELARLESCLAAGEAARVCTACICLHHQPVPVGCEWLDEQMVSDAPAFLRYRRTGFRRVRGVLWGHVHQELDQTPGRCAAALFAIDLRPVSPGAGRFRPGSAAHRATAGWSSGLTAAANRRTSRCRVTDLSRGPRGQRLPVTLRQAGGLAPLRRRSAARPCSGVLPSGTMQPGQFPTHQADRIPQ